MDRPPTLIALPPGRPGLVFPMRMARPWEVEGPHHHRGTELNLVVRGHARRLVGEQVLTTTPGCLVHLAAGAVHRLLDGSGDLAYWVIWSRRPWRGRGEGCVRRLSAADRRDLERLCALAAARGESPAAPDLLAACLALATEVWNGARPCGTPSRPLHPAVAAAVDLMQRRQGLVNLDVVAAAGGLSRSRLSHVFSRELGLTMAAYRNLCRLEAVDALRRRRPAASLADLAREAGFAGYNQFYRAHRRLRGLPPSEA